MKFAFGKVSIEAEPEIRYQGKEIRYMVGGTVFHRLNGPARIRPGVFEMWYMNGYIHRADGPGVVWLNSNGDVSEVEWYWRGMGMKFEEWCELAQPSDDLRLLLTLKYKGKQ